MSSRHRTTDLSRHRLSIENLENRELLVSYPTVVIETNVGEIPIELYDDTAPDTVANFLDYVDGGDYVNAIFHRVMNDFVVQGGGFRSNIEELCSCALSDLSVATIDPADFDEVPVKRMVDNEFQRSNVEGTLAMAKRANNPDSATNQFFVNTRDNGGPPAALDQQNGGFTVFAGLLEYSVIESIETGDVVNLSSIFPPSEPLAAVVSAAVFEENTPAAVNIVRMESFSGTAIIEGRVFQDLDREGSITGSEGGIPDAEVYIDANNNGMLDDTETVSLANDLGEFEFRVDPGQYTIRVSPPADYVSTSSQQSFLIEATVGRRYAGNDLGLVYDGVSWHNSRFPTDVDGMNGTTPIDALLAVNELTSRQFSDPKRGTLMTLTAPPQIPQFLDVIQDNFFAPLDALTVINNLTGVDRSALSSQTVVTEPPQTKQMSVSQDMRGASLVDEDLDDDRWQAIERVFATNTY